MSDPELSDEHIIPYGLNGNLVLPKASCKECAKITSSAELRVLRGFLNNGRRALGIESRHKKRSKPKAAPVKLITENGYIDGESPFDSGIHTIHLPIFATPLTLGGQSKDDNLDSIDIRGFDTIQFGHNIPTIKGQTPHGIQIKTRVHIWAFIQVLAKIAYSYHIAIKGVFPREECPVLPIVLGNSRTAKPWIGCLEDQPLSKPGSTALHLMDLNELTNNSGAACTVVRIKLLSTSSGPTYSVITRIHNQLGRA